MTLEDIGITICEDEGHVHDGRCRIACEVCDVLVPPRDLREGVCRPCWDEFDAMDAERETGGEA